MTVLKDLRVTCMVRKGALERQRPAGFRPD
jgi:hypothetical protein